MADETAFIAAMRALAVDPAARGLADDAAVLDFGAETLVVTHDMMVEGIHWLAGQDPADVAWKLVATNLSDLAAKGAEPVGVLVGYTLGTGDGRFAEGLGQALRAFGVPLLGGDTVSAGLAGGQTHGLTALGRATFRPVPSRAGARAGQKLWITGYVGAAMLGFEALRRDISGGGPGGDAATAAFRRPVPRLAEGRLLAPHVTAMMDVSDGLLLDATRLAEASGVTVAIEASRVPLAAGLPATRAADAMGWGDDYELLFTLPADMLPACAATCIGTVLPRGDAPLLLDGAVPTGRTGYVHG